MATDLEQLFLQIELIDIYHLLVQKKKMREHKNTGKEDGNMNRW